MKNQLKLILASLSILIASIILTKPAVSQQVEMSLPEINQKSDLILQVLAESVESRWEYSTEGRNIVTLTQFRVIECIKGNKNTNQTYSLEMLGGKVGDTTQYVSSSVIFTPGEESILFLQNDPDYVTGGYQGKYRVINDKVSVDNQNINRSRFIGILKESRNDPQALPAFLKEIHVEPLTVSESRLKGSTGTTGTNSTNDTYAISGLKSSFAGTTDSDGDGYYENFTFTIQVNGDAVPGPATVFFRINCTTTGQTWTSINSYVITGSEVDYKNFGYDQSNFAGRLSGNQELSFTVDLLDASKAVLATDATVTGDLIKVDEAAAPPLTISSISPDRQSAGTNSEITISGSSFGASQGTGKVEFFYRTGQPTIPANIISWSNNQIICTVPIASVSGYPASAASGPVTVTNNAGQTSNGYPFRVTFGFGGTKWAANSMTFRINENLSSISGESQAIQNAANSWNAANANFRFEYGGTHTNTTSARNSNNDMMWGTVANSNVLGQASVWYSGSTILECDIIFNNSINWSAGASVPSGTIDVETVSLHEMGHWLNLRDLYGSFNDGEYDQMKVMYGLSYYGQSKRNPHSDDVSGIQWIYGMAESVSISGYVKTAAGAAVPGVVLSGLPGDPETNSNGFYSGDVPTGWTGNVTPVKTGYTFSLASHTYSNQTTSLTDQDFTATAANNDATLSDLKVSGTTVTGFVKTQLSYSIQLPAGTTAVPPVTATTTDSNATKVITPAASIPGNTSVRVTAQDGTTVLTYTIAFTLPVVSSDATLSELKVDGTLVSGFSPSTLSYAVVLPDGTTAVPAVTATTASAAATKVITPAASLPGSTTVVVTAENGTTKKTYTVNFSIAKNDDATLSNLQVSGNTVAGFVKTTLTYTVPLPYGTTAVPVVTATTSDPNASKVITPATSLPGNTRVIVTAEDGTTTQTYTVSFTLSEPSADASLSDLKVDGISVDGFNPATLSYAVLLPYGTSAVPPLTATTSNISATLAITPAASLPGTSTVVVTAQNGTTKKTYTVNLTVAKNNDATLSDLMVSGTTVPGFVKNTLSYNVVLPYGTTTVPPVTAVASDNNATLAVTPAPSLPGTTRILVTADNGTTTLQYTVSFTREPASTNASLSDLKVNGTTVSGFDPNILSYLVELPAGTTSVPDVTATTTNAYASVEVQPAGSLPGITSVIVTAQDGITSKTYSINFSVNKSSDATLSNLAVDGTRIAGFMSNDLTYTVELPFGTTVVPAVTATPTDANATTVITSAASLPGNTYVQVTAEDGTTYQTYTITFTLSPASTVATLSDLMVDGTSITGFDPSVTWYTYTLPLGSNTIPAVTAVTSHPDATAAINPASTIPGSTSVTVTSQSLTVTKTYTVNFVRGKNNDASLADLLVDGTTVAGFSKNILNYSLRLPFGTTAVPVVTATLTDNNATGLITQAASLPGTAHVQVTAEDGVSILTYSISFMLMPPSNDATLSSLRIDGLPVAGFMPTSVSYQVTLPSGTTRVPDVQAVTNESHASVVIMRANALPGITTVQVTAQDASTRMDYSIMFNVAKNTDATLSDILINGSPIANFDRADLSYEIVIPSGTTLPPTITPITTDLKASVAMTLPDAIPGTATIRVIAEDGVTSNNYEILVRYPLSGINENIIQNNLKVYPNPNNGSFTFEYTMLNIKPVLVSVSDLTGRVVFEHLYAGNSIRLSEMIQLSGQPQGAYFMRLIEGSSVSWQKIIVE